MSQTLQKPRIHRSIVTISAITALALFGDSLLYSVLPLHAEQLGLSTLMVGVILSLNRWVRLLSNSFAAWSFRRYKVSLPIFIASVLAVITTLVYAFPLGAAVFIMARVIWGVCYSHFRLGGYMVALKTNHQMMGLAMGTIQSVSRLGSAFSVAAGGILVDRLGYQWGMALLALLSGFALPLVFSLERQLQEVPDTTQDREDAKSEVRKQERVVQDLIPVPLLNIFGFLTYLVGNGMVVSTISIILRDRIGLSTDILGLTLGIATIAGFVSSINWISALVIAPIAGRLSDRLGRRKPFIIVSLLQGLCLAGVSLVNSGFLTILLLAFFFIFTNAQKVFVDAAAGDFAHVKGSSKMISIYNSCQDLGAAVGPLMGYWLGSLIGFSMAYGLGAVVLFGVSALTILQRHQTPSSGYSC